MNVLILNGSPRAHGNTSAMVEAFADEAISAGHEVHVVQIGNKDIRGCRNCDVCRKTLNGNCVQKDYMQEVLPLMREWEVALLLPFRLARMQCWGIWEQRISAS